MLVAVYANVRTTWHCNVSIDLGFHTAFHGGKVLGFALVGLGILVLQVLILVYKSMLLPEKLG